MMFGIEPTIAGLTAQAKAYGRSYVRIDENLEHHEVIITIWPVDSEIEQVFLQARPAGVIMIIKRPTWYVELWLSLRSPGIALKAFLRRRFPR